MPAPVYFKYRAFLSYAHANLARGKQLHGQLESFRIDKDLAGRETPRGPVPKSLRPIFRDREDFTGGHTLTDATIAALDASAALIVLCSTVAATRPAVNEEVRLFRWRHPERPVIPVIIDGTWPDNFPPALRFEIEPDGSVSDQPITILGPDLRETADGRQLGLAKIVAGLVGVGTDEIVRRAERDRLRRLRSWIAGLSTVIVALAGLMVWAEINRRDAVAQRVIAEDQRQLADQRRQEADRNFTLAKGAAEGLVFDIAQALRNVEGMRAETVAKILETARVTFEKLSDAAPDNWELKRSRGAMLSEFGDTYAAQGNLAAALTSYRASLDVAERLVKADPANAGWQRDLSAAHLNIGNVLRHSNLPAALESYRTSLAIVESLAKADPGNMGWKSDAALSHLKIGEVLRAHGNLPAALESYQAAVAISEHLAKLDPDNAEWQNNFSSAHDAIGEVLQRQGNLTAALESYRVSLAVAERLTKLDPSSTGSQTQVYTVLARIADAKLDQGNLSSALTDLRRAQEIMERLTKADPSNASWQDYLSGSHEKIGQVLQAQGNQAAALERFRASLAIIERLYKASPGNARWQSLLSLSHEKIGDGLFAQGDMKAAMESYQASLAISERLLEADPNDAGKQRNVYTVLVRIAKAKIKQGDLASPLTDLRRGHDIMEKLVKADPGNAHWQNDLSVSHLTIGELLHTQGNLPTALENYNASIAIAEQLAKLDPSNAGWQRHLALSRGGVAMVLADQGMVSEAIAVLSAGRNIIERLRAQTPGSATLPEDLVWFDQQMASLVSETKRKAEQEAKREVPQPGQTFRDCSDGCPVMVVVPAGKFTMGTSAGSIAALIKEYPAGRDAWRSEEPSRMVIIQKPFAVGKFEVTFDEWEACVAGGGCTNNATPSDVGWGRGRRPVVNVSWHDAKEFVAWLSKKTGRNYRLLTDAEWEYAARSGSSTRFFWGNSDSELCGFANGADVTAKETNPDWKTANCSDGHGNSAPVGSFKPNAFGLYDMLGNVWEWVADCWHANYFGAPSDGGEWTTGCHDSGSRVVRGGAFSYSPPYLRSASRAGDTATNRFNFLGFRVGMTF